MRRTALFALIVLALTVPATQALAQKTGPTPYRQHETKMSTVERQLNTVARRVEAARAALEGAALEAGTSSAQFGALRDMLTRTTELHDHLQGLARDRRLMDSWGGMDSYKRASRDLEKLSDALASLTSHLVEVAKADSKARR